MKPYNEPIHLIADYSPEISSKSLPATEEDLKQAGIPVISCQSVGGDTLQAKNLDPPFETPGQIIINTGILDTEMHPWDLAHSTFNASAKLKYVEPDIWQEFAVEDKMPQNYNDVSAKSFGSGAIGDNVDPDWPPAQNDIWHLDENFSQLGAARERAARENEYTIRIGHLDTGHSNHPVIPQHVRDNVFQRNFVNGEDNYNAADRGSEGLLKQPYHGTGTGGILFGGKVELATANGNSFTDYLGAAYFADIVTCRISKSVVLFKSSAFADALNYLTNLHKSGTAVHVVSMSMGGAPSKSWTKAVNAAYDAGITVVTAAGNNFSGAPTRHLVYPARFQRVIAACGVTYDFSPYYTKLVNEMQGNFGPSNKMSKALAAFTPNMPWASPETGSIQFNGAGTSSATPQIAAAAAMYYKVHHKELDSLQPWQRVEAIRHALYTSAKKTVKQGFGDYRKYFGNGILQANDALDVPVRDDLSKTTEDTTPWFPILNTLFKNVPSEEEQVRLDMFNTELFQLLYTYPELEKLIIDDAEVDFENVEIRQWDRLALAIMAHPGASRTLKAFLKSKYEGH